MKKVKRYFTWVSDTYPTWKGKEENRMSNTEIFVHDINRDTRFPRRAESYQQLKQYLISKKAGDRAMDSLRMTWKAYMEYENEFKKLEVFGNVGT